MRQDWVKKQKVCFRLSKGILYRQALAKGEVLEKVNLIALPFYTPHYNPIEHVQETTKADLSGDQLSTFEITKQKFTQLADQIFCY